MAPSLVVVWSVQSCILMTSGSCVSGVRMELISAWQAFDEQGSTESSGKKHSKLVSLALSFVVALTFTGALSQ